MHATMPPRLAALFAGGGTGGAYEVGSMIKILEDTGAVVTTAYGVSFGALMTAAIAYKRANVTDLEAIRAAEQMLYDALSNRFIFGIPNPFVLCGSQSLLTLNTLVDIIDENFPDKDYRQDVVCTVFTTDMQTGRMDSVCNIGTSSADFKRAIRASASIPFFFEPVPMHGHMQSDGATCLNMVPVPPASMASHSWDIMVVCMCHFNTVRFMRSTELTSATSLLKRFAEMTILHALKTNVEQIVQRVQAAERAGGKSTRLLLIYPRAPDEHPLTGTTVDMVRDMVAHGKQLATAALACGPSGNRTDTWLARKDLVEF